MSNPTTTSPKEGQSRRRRSRGGNNRNRSNNRSRNSEEFRPKGPRPPKNAPPVQLSWWQKFLQAIGLYKTPVNGRAPSEDPKTKVSPAKSNTRNARSPESAPGNSKRAPRKTKERGGDPSTVESARVYVGNLSYDATEHDLEELFKGVGSVRSVEIVYNRATHRSKGYAFVEMLHRDDAVRAVEVLHDQPFMGRNMIVSGAKSRTDGDEDEEVEGPESAVVVAPVPAAAVDSPAEQDTEENKTTGS